jgi:RimJ/RimL family protein N-acetyltransferase
MDKTTATPVQPVGAPLPHWTPRSHPPRTPMSGLYGGIEPIDVDRHAQSLFEANAADATGAHWTYLFDDKPATPEAYRAWLARVSASEDPMFHAIVDGATGRALGVAAFMRIDRHHGVIEVGHINFAPALQRTRLATEAIFLMMSRVFDELGYRRFEWKCDSLNAPSRAAAQRFGFTFEGIFRQAVVYKGRNRDTAWYSITDREWPALRAAYRRWLEPSNFDAAGRQRERLSALTRPSAPIATSGEPPRASR